MDLDLWNVLEGKKSVLYPRKYGINNDTIIITTQYDLPLYDRVRRLYGFVGVVRRGEDFF